MPRISESRTNPSGFTVPKKDTSPNEINSADTKFIENAYFIELEAFLYEQFPEYERFEVLDHQVHYTIPPDNSSR